MPLNRLHSARRYPIAFLALLLLALSSAAIAAPVRILTDAHATPREKYGAERLRATVADMDAPANTRILLAVRTSPLLDHYQVAQFWPGATEAFILRRVGNTFIVAGSDPSGVLYGALELAARIQQAHALPVELDYEDHPALKLRGTAIGMQKPEITYEGAEYDYLYTPQNFPFFYDKAAWTRYLDMLVNERMNTLYLWNGHPFTSLLKLPKYPEAQELSDAQLQQNIEMFRWLTREADKRGIWILQGFYNIHLSHTFARAHHLPYHLSTPTPLATEYTRYAISEFIRSYPNVGLMMTLGEALSPHYGAQWLTQAIIPGVKDGLQELSKVEGHPVPEPPIVVRAHATDIEDVLAAAKPLYSNIDTMFKWNGESLTWTNVRGPVLDRFKSLVAQSNVTISNIHLLSNLEPFRWGDPDFIRQTLLHFQRIGIDGLHVYPLRYWDWPVSADNPPLLQVDRDWIWYEAWGRYAWNPNRDPQKEHAYWVARIASHYGTSQAAEYLLAAYELSGICAPRLLPRIGITEGNRQAFSLGMLMTELIDPNRYNPATTLWTGDAPAGERLSDYVALEVKHAQHHGETPIGVADEVVESSAKALQEAKAAAPYVTENQAEYKRFVNDMRCIHTLMLFYQAKTHAAEQVLLYGYDHNTTHLQQAETLLTQSVDQFRHLASLTDGTYRSAAGLETSQRRIPMPGGPDNYPNWSSMLPVYEKELAIFQSRLAALDTGKLQPSEAAPKPFPQVGFHLAPGAGEVFHVAARQQVFTDAPATIATVAPELQGMTGIRVSMRQTAPLHFTLDQPAQILVGFFKKAGRKASPVDPDTEQWNLLLPDAVTAGKLSLSVWAKPVPAGLNDLDLGKGAYTVIGFIPENLKIKPHVTFSTTGTDGQPPNLDWLFEN